MCVELENLTSAKFQVFHNFANELSPWVVNQIQ